MEEDKLYKDYLVWFKEQFDLHPEETYSTISVISELVAMRNEYQDKIPRPNILDYSEPEEVKKMLDRLRIITFEEYKNSK